MKLKFLFLFLALSFVAFAQVPRLEDLPAKVQREYKRDVKEVEQNRKDAIRDGYDIFPDPVETPIVIPAEFFNPGNLEIISWQTRLQRVAELQARIKAECKFPVHFKISDSGVDQTHPDLKAGFVKEFDWTGEGNGPGSHGTHVCGDVLQFMYPLVATGVVTYDDQKSLTAQGSGSFAWAANMFLSNLPDVLERTKKGQTVIYNCSWGGGTAPIESIEIQMRKTVENGGIIVAAAGNSGGAVGYPGNSKHVFGIASLDESMVISSFSSRGPEVDGTAGGRNIYSTLPGGQYGLASGTSMASPSFAAIFVGYARAKWGPVLLPDYPALMQYYKKIAVQVGNGDPQLYGFGYPYITAILDTKPDSNTPDPPPPPPTDPPAPEPGEFYAAGIADAGYIMRWRYETETDFRLLYISRIEWETMGGGSEAEAYKAASDFIAKYFMNRAIVLPAEMGNYSATWWTGQFLEYIARNEKLYLQVYLVEGKDETGHYRAIGFDKADTAARGFFSGVRMETW
jgi:hypothetical protein